jgi:hypothetical protein
MASPKGPPHVAAAARKADRERDALQAMREYQAEQARVDANTARLRALRLAKAAEAAADQASAAKKSPDLVTKSTRAGRSRNSARGANVT